MSAHEELRTLESLSTKQYDKQGKAYYAEERVELRQSYSSIGKVVRSDQEYFELRDDLGHAIESLSLEERQLCSTYLKVESLSAVATELGKSCKTVYRRRDQLKVQLSESCLREYR